MTLVWILVSSVCRLHKQHSRTRRASAGALTGIGSKLQMQINGRRRLVTNAFLDFMQLLLERERERYIDKERGCKKRRKLIGID